MGTSKEFNEERTYWLDEISKKDEWKLVEQKGDYCYYRLRWKDMGYGLDYVPVENRVKFYKDKIIAESGIFCPDCDKLMISVEDGTEWTGGIFSVKSPYSVHKCKKCGYKIKW